MSSNPMNNANIIERIAAIEQTLKRTRNVSQVKNQFVDEGYVAFTDAAGTVRTVIGNLEGWKSDNIGGTYAVGVYGTVHYSSAFAWVSAVTTT